MAWLRLYDDILDDPKVQMLPDRAFRMFINCLCLAKRNDGKLPSDMSSLAFSLRLPTNKTADTFQVLLSVGLMDRNSDGTFTPHNWHGRQYESDNAAERMRRYRDRQRDAALRNEQRNSYVPDSETEQNRTESPQTPQGAFREGLKNGQGRKNRIANAELGAAEALRHLAEHRHSAKGMGAGNGTTDRASNAGTDRGNASGPGGDFSGSEPGPEAGEPKISGVLR